MNLQVTLMYYCEDSDNDGDVDDAASQSVDWANNIDESFQSLKPLELLIVVAIIGVLMRQGCWLSKLY